VNESAPVRTVSLGKLPFSLSAEELDRRGKESLREQRERLAELLGRPGPFTVDNFLEPLDRILVAVHDVGAHCGLMFQVHPDATTRDVGRRLSEGADRFFNEFRVNDEIYRRLRSLPLDHEDDETRLCVEKMVREMRRSGSELSPSEREQIISIQNRLDQTSNEFSENIANADRGVMVDSPQALRGLPPDYIAGHPPGPDGRIRITTRYPDLMPAMNFADEADLRRRLLLEFMNVAYPENLPVLHRLLADRRDLAQRLGYPDFARFVLEDKMAERPEVVSAFLDKVGRVLTEPARADLARFLDRKRRFEPEATELEDWDGRLWPPGYYAMKIRQEEYGVDLRVLRDYLPYTAVRDGLFALCRELFHLEFVPATGAEVWHPTVEAFDVRRAGVPIGRCYLDLIPRPGKFNHAAQFSVRAGTARGALPQGSLVCNFFDGTTPPDAARMEYSQVVVFFHEFGHLIHHLLSEHRRWLYTSMGFIEWDFIEAPSQLFEEWARDPATLATFARNPQTGEPIPAAMVARLQEAEAVGRAAWALRQVALATISLEVHVRDPESFDPVELQRATYRDRVGVQLNPEYHQIASFGHLTGYSAIYYTYLWSAVIARDLLTPFYAKGSLTDPEMAERYANEVLAPGASQPAGDLVRNFLGREYSFDAFQRWVLAGTAPRA
jgi:thimet oligopeptidase